jgi:hypothetical protein
MIERLTPFRWRQLTAQYDEQWEWRGTSLSQ